MCQCQLLFQLLFQFLSTMIRAHLLLQLRTNLDTRLTLGFVDYLSQLPYDFFQRRSMSMAYPPSIRLR